MQKAKFLKGSIFKHVITMSTTNAIGLLAIFMVDLVDIYFISLLENNDYTAAVGYASAIIFITTALSIGLTIANSALVAKLIAQQKQADAKRYVSHLTLFATLFTSLIAFFIWYFAPLLLSALGAQGETLTQATSYVRIVIFGAPILAITMQMNATLRSLADAKHAMYATVSGAIINALLDPVFIFVFAMDLQGAAYASLIARISALFIALFYVINKHQMLIKLNYAKLITDFKKISQIAVPAMFTQLATPFGNLYVTYEIAKYGTAYIAAWAIIGRIIPVVFCVMFAVSGAIGPIISQNFGVLNFSRLQQTFTESLKFTTGYCLVVALALSFGQEKIVTIFNAEHETAMLIRIFCQHIAVTFIFTGITFIAMAFLNNLGYPKYATLLNIGKMTLGTIPFVTIGAFLFGGVGILYGQALGSIVFGFIALFLTRHLMFTIQMKHKRKKNDQPSSS
ncbi:MATE family efflux transporter [Psychromonas sp. psych-6C06]|nr:MATE family efflux transporter [Psychromonas sp. psych-6C06]